jgi:hypothetical protein
MNILFRHQEALSRNEIDLRLAKNFTHKIQLEMSELVYKKQLKHPEAYNQFVKQTLEE